MGHYSQVSKRDWIEFSDVDRNVTLGIKCKTVLSIEEISMYRFAVTSDDGSTVWIDEKKIIDNDFSEGMHMKADIIALRSVTLSKV